MSYVLSRKRNPFTSLFIRKSPQGGRVASESGCVNPFPEKMAKIFQEKIHTNKEQLSQSKQKVATKAFLFFWKKNYSGAEPETRTNVLLQLFFETIFLIS